MSRTKSEVRAFLDSQIGRKVVCQNNRYLDGQCVTLIKALLNFLGAPNPWKARGNGGGYASRLAADGVARRADGWLRVCSSNRLGRPYGHVWIDLRGETNYESNGARRLIVTKGTRSISLADVIVNLDAFVLEDPKPVQSLGVRIIARNGTFKAAVNRNIRWDSPTGTVGGVFTAGSTQRFTGYCDYGNFRYVTWKGGSGHQCFTAIKRLSDGKRYGSWRCY